MKEDTLEYKTEKCSVPDNGVSFWRLFIAILYTVLIFASIPFFPAVWDFLSISYPSLLNLLELSFVPTLIITFFLYCYYARRKRNPLFYFGSAMIFVSLVLIDYYFCEYPAERFHLVEYILLVILAYKALSPRIKSISIYGVILLYAFGIGILDEIFQYVLPNREFSVRDILINCASACLGICLVAGVTWKQPHKS